MMILDGTVMPDTCGSVNNNITLAMTRGFWL